MMPEQSSSQDQEQHLYLVFDDWISGYSIRKVRLSSGPSKGAKPQPLPPAFMRLEASRGFPELFTSAFGPKIIMMHPEDDPSKGVPTIDVQDLTVDYKIPLNYAATPIYIPVSEDRLFALDNATFKVLCEPEIGEPWVWKNLTRHPFRIWNFHSCCVQPDGCILFSTEGNETFLFDTKEYVWSKCGDWAFPFDGRGHYDSSLQGYVGLNKDGYLFCCTINSTMTGLDTVKSLGPKSFDFKGAKGNEVDKKQFVSATLVHMCPGKFCIVQCISIVKRMTAEELHDDLMRLVPAGDDPFGYMGGGPQGGRFMYCLKTFSLSHDTKGDLKLEDPKLYRYSLPDEARVGTIHKDPVAFWL